MMKRDSAFRGVAKGLATAISIALLCVAAGAQAAPEIKSHYAFKKPKIIEIPGDLSFDTNGMAAPVVGATPQYVLGFEGISQYDGASFGRNFIPPDTMGAVGRTQYVETSNGAYAVFDKATGNRLSLVSDVGFWAAAGQTGANGDSRVMYNAAASRWVVVSFGANVQDLQIAVSDTDNALGGWKSVKFTGFAGGTADYPTLAMDTNAVYVGTNNFKVGCFPGNPAANAFCGTTLNVIPINSLFNAGAPTVANMAQLVTPFTYVGPPTDVDRGFAQQGVNSTTPGSTGTILAGSLFDWDNVAFQVTGLTPDSASLAALTPASYLGMDAFTSPGLARQPAADPVPGFPTGIAANRRVIDSLDERISSSVYEANGRIYMVNTVNSSADGLDETRVRYTVIDASTFAILDQGDIGEAGYDYYQGSIAVNADGDVVIGYNRSGLDPATGVISFFARTYMTGADGKLIATGGEIFLKESLTDDYHNGSLYGQPAAGRQRWGDYSQVSIDPENNDLFWVIGQFAREYNLPEFGHPGGTGGSRWGTWIAVIDVSDMAPVPEPEAWLLMLAGFAALWRTEARRRRTALRFRAN